MSFKVKIVFISLCAFFLHLLRYKFQAGGTKQAESAGETVSDYASREPVPSVG